MSVQEAATDRTGHIRGGALFEIAPIAIARATPDGVLLDVNSEFVRMVGFPSRDALMAVNATNLYPDPRDRERWKAIAARQDAAQGFEVQLRCYDGTLIWIRLHSRAVRDRNGQIVEYVNFFEDTTERKGAEEALRKSEERFRELIKHSWDSVLLTDAAGTITYVGPNVKPLLGYTPEERIGGSIFDLIISEDRERAKGVLHALARAPGMSLKDEFRARHRDGSVRWLEGVGTNLLATPPLEAVVVNFHDITERKQAEAALQASEVRFRALIEHSYDGIVLLRPDGTIMYTSPAASRIWGKAPEHLIGWNALDLLEGADRERASAALTQVIDTPGERVQGEYRFKHADGSWRWLEASGVNLLDEPAVAGIILSFRDITKRKLAEDTLRQQEEQFRSLIEYSADVTAIIDEDGIIKYQSASLERVLGYMPEETVGRSGFEFVHPDDLPKAKESLAAALQHPGESVTREYRHRHKDGSWRTLESTGVVRVSDSGQRIVISNSRDVTDRKLAEEALKRRTEELAALNQTAQMLGAVQDLAGILDLIHGMIGRVLDNRNTYVALYDETRQIVSFPVYTIEGQRKPPTQRTFGNGLTEYVIRTKAPLLISSDVEDALASRGIDLIGRGAVSILAVPIISREKVLGVICVQDYQKENVYDIHHAELLSTFAQQAAIAIENARLFEESRHRIQQLQALRDIDAAIGGSVDLRIMLAVFLDKVTTELHVDAADIVLLAPKSGTLELVAHRGFLRTPECSLFRLGEGLAGGAILERRVVRIPAVRDALGQSERDGDFQREEFASYVGAPLLAKGQIRGALEVFQRSQFSPTREWLDFLETLAGQAAIAIDAAQTFDDLQRANLDLTLAYDTTLEGWSRALDLRDKETEGHTQRTADMSVRLAGALRMREEEIVHLRRGALLHDIGKMGIADSILLKPGPLTEDEQRIMRQHPTFAYRLLYPISFLRPALDIPYCHHEKFDGTGYPRGLKGDQIPLAARIFAVVDVWDALRSERPYRRAWPAEQALTHIREEAGTHFDPKVVDAFLQMLL